MKNIILFLFLYLIIIAQSTFIQGLAFFGVKFNLFLIFIITMVLLAPYPKVMLLAFLGGLISDFFSAEDFGVITLSMIATVYLLKLIASPTAKSDSLWITLSIGVIGTFAYSAFIWLNLAIFNYLGIANANIHYWYDLTREILPQSILNTLLLILIFYAYKRIKRRFLFSHKY